MKVSELVDALLEMPQSMEVKVSYEGVEEPVRVVFKDRVSVIISDIREED